VASVGDPLFLYNNEDGQIGEIRANMPGWGTEIFGDDFESPFMLIVEGEAWMDADTLPVFIEWLQGLQAQLEVDNR